MPLSPPAPRKHLHNRDIHCKGYYRDDGMWDIEGHITDTKTYSFDSDWKGEMVAGTPVHQMWVRITIDDDMMIQSAEAVTDDGPFPICPNAAPNFSAMSGIRIGPGWTRKAREAIGVRHGCTHIFELLAQMGTVAYQTHVAKRRMKAEREGRALEEDNEARKSRRSPLLNTCYAFADDREVVRDLWPEQYAGSDKVDA